MQGEVITSGLLKMTFFRRLKGHHIGFLCVAGGVPALAIPTVSAADSAEGRKVKISQLPLYDDETKSQYEYKYDPPSSFQETISTIRQAVWEYLDSMKETTSVVTDKLMVAKAHTSSMITYVQDDPSILPKASVITVAGLGGIVAGYRGGILRKLFLSASAMTAAAALCYPNETVALTTEAYDNAYKYGRSLWEGDSSAETSTAPQQPKPVKDVSAVVNKNLEDHGQSKPEDKDMYTTRGS